MFRDRADAGKRLARALRDLPRDVVVLGIARGGVIVARALADALSVACDVVVARKIGAPNNPELAIGAVGSDGAVILDERVLASIDPVDESYVGAARERETREIERRLAAYRGARSPIDTAGRTCVIVDDGIATGSTARAAIASVRRAGAASVVLAVPVMPRAAVPSFEAICDHVVALETPDTFYAVGQFYEEFREIGDDEVRGALKDPVK